MITQIIEEPSRFGALSEFVDRPHWQTLSNSFQCRVAICPEVEGGFSAIALRLPGVVSEGETIDEAINNIREAFAGAIHSYREANEPIPWKDVEVECEKSFTERRILVNV